MAQESKAESGREFARDMRRVRESRHITVGDLHNETKIPMGLIEAFEETALFDHPQFNRVYLRSFVRTYANVLGIEPDVALEALEEALSDRYAGLLGVEYLGEAPEAAVAEPEARGGEDAEEATAEESAPPVGTRPGRKPAEEPEPDKGTKMSEVAAEEASEDQRAAEKKRSSKAKPSKPKQPEDTPESEETEEDDEDVSPTFVSTTSEAAAGYGIGEAAESADESEWSAQSPPSAKPTPPSTERTSRRQRTAYRDRPGGLDWRWVAGGIAVVVVAAVVWIIVSMSGNGASDAGEMATAVDTAAVAAERDADQESPDTTRGPMPVIGDTIDVYIVAANAKVDPIRVTVDDDLRRPYWIEQGDSMLFQPRDRIVIEELIDNIRLNIEGASYPTSRRDEQGRIVITRDSLQAYLGAGRSQ